MKKYKLETPEGLVFEGDTYDISLYSASISAMENANIKITKKSVEKFKDFTNQCFSRDKSDTSLFSLVDMIAEDWEDEPTVEEILEQLELGW